MRSLFKDENKIKEYTKRNKRYARHGVTTKISEAGLQRIRRYSICNAKITIRSLNLHNFLVPILSLVVADIERGDSSFWRSESFEEKEIVEKVFIFCKLCKFEIGCRARFVDSEGHYQGGAVCWTGYKKSRYSPKLVVVCLVSRLHKSLHIRVLLLGGQNKKKLFQGFDCIREAL